LESLDEGRLLRPPEHGRRDAQPYGEHRCGSRP
jgi:hypothetical protein